MVALTPSATSANVVIGPPPARRSRSPDPPSCRQEGSLPRAPRCVYRPVGLNLTGSDDGAEREGADGGCDVDGAPGAPCDRGPGSSLEAALLRPGVLRPRGRPPVAPRLADGVPAGGDPRAR